MQMAFHQKGGSKLVLILRVISRFPRLIFTPWPLRDYDEPTFL
jgi:hypothetical protein